MSQAAYEGPPLLMLGKDDDEFDVSPEHFDSALKDGLEPAVVMKNPKTGEKLNVRKSHLDHALKDGLQYEWQEPQKPREQDPLESQARGFSEGATWGGTQHVVGAANALGAALGPNGMAMLGMKDAHPKESMGEAYARGRKDWNENLDQAFEQNPGSTWSGVAAPAILSGVAGVAKAALPAAAGAAEQVIGKAAPLLASALGQGALASRADLRTPEGRQRMGEDVTTAAEIGMAVPVAGGIMSEAKRLIPGTANASRIVNKGMSYLNKLNPMQRAKQGTLEELYNNPALRQQARDFDPKTAARSLEEAVGAMKEDFGTKLGQEFEAARGKAAQSLTVKDLADFNPDGILQRSLLEAEKRPTFYSPNTSKVLENARAMVAGEGPYQTAVNTQRLTGNRTLIRRASAELEKLKGQLATATSWAQKRGIENRIAQAEQYLATEGAKPAVAEDAYEAANKARNYLDQFIRNDVPKPGSGFTHQDQQLLHSARGNLDAMLKTKLGAASDTQRYSDEIYHGFKNNFEPFIESMSRDGTPDASKAITTVLGGGNQRELSFELANEKAQEYLQKYPQLEQLPAVQHGMQYVQKILEQSKMQKVLGQMEQAGGGPTSQTGLGMLQTYLFTLNPKTIALFPVINPTGYMRIIDAIAKSGDTETAMRLKQFGDVVGQAVKQQTIRGAVQSTQTPQGAP